MLEPSVLCHILLGRSPSDGEHNFTCLTLARLRVNFKELSSTVTKNEVMCAARAYIIQLIRGWGSAMLAILYCELYRATKHGFLWMSYSALNIATFTPKPIQFMPIEPQQFADVHKQFILPRHRQFEFISPRATTDIISYVW
ncbi:hypothetical protein GOBAR_DD33843 [Gossypium barbadense]|nr:hypothetical protein GOBAR_DD33843 [Gossypium barbadense]